MTMTDLAPAPHSLEQTVCVSSQLRVWDCPLAGEKSAVVGIFTPQKQASATSQGSVLPAFQSTPADTQPRAWYMAAVWNMRAARRG